MSWASDFIAEYVAAFNAAVVSGDFAPVLRRFTDDAVMRFENVPPGGGAMEFAGRPSYTAAYAKRPPDDQIDLLGEPSAQGGHLVTRFAWRRDSSAGLLDLTVTDGLISRMTVIFG